MDTWTQRLSEQLDSIGTMFQEGELAYLALTQKVEYAVRDKLAFALHRKWGERDSLLVCREWNRIDLAILEDSSPQLLLEAKAQYTFDIVKHGVPHNYPDLLLRDVQKLSPRRLKHTEVFTLLLATHPHTAPERRYRDAVKYFADVARYASIPISTEQADAEIVRRLADHPLAKSGVIDGGSAFGIAVSVVYWLFGPYKNEV